MTGGLKGDKEGLKEMRGGVWVGEGGGQDGSGEEERGHAD